MNILGVSALYHDSAAAMCVNGNIIAAAQEERFTRKKADSSLPVNAIRFCKAQLKDKEKIDAVVYYDNPLLTLDRWLNNCIMVSPNNSKIIEKSFTSMFSDKLWIHDLLNQNVYGKSNGKVLVCEHHISHAASAFYPSPFEEAAIMTIDGVGEWATTTIGFGKNEKIDISEQLNYPHSLGLLYSAFTYFCGFKVNFGEYKLMGLAPYGDPIYYEKILNNLVEVSDDGSIKLNMDYFAFMHDNMMIDSKFEELFGVKRRQPEDIITRVYIDLAASIQKVTEEIIIKMARHAKCQIGGDNLVLAGGVALNCVANGKLVKEKIFKNIWIQPAAGDAGGALGAALYATYNYFDCKRVIEKRDSQKGSYLGPSYSKESIKKFLDNNQYHYDYYEDNQELYDKVAEYLHADKIIGLFNGKMEFGPRALGGRSIIANPMSEAMQSKLNMKIKYRESFRPFAPAVLEERVNDYFDLDGISPYMLICASVKEEIREKSEINLKEENLLNIINQKRSIIPAVTHVDYSARIQTVSEEDNTFFYNIIKAFDKLTGCGVIVNTSFNVRGEPIVCSPEDAYLCFMRTDMDVLVLENYILLKQDQLPLSNDEDWRLRYELD